MAITEDEFTSFLDFDDNITRALMKLDRAARTRHIIDAVQLEDMWQQLDEESQTFNLYIAMRLSPKTLWGCLESDVELNCLEWRLVLPKYADMAFPQISRQIMMSKLKWRITNAAIEICP
jgi:hypothetical protein